MSQTQTPEPASLTDSAIATQQTQTTTETQTKTPAPSLVVGIRHVHLKVANIPIAIAFYEAAFGFRVGHSAHDGGMAFLQIPGGDDLLTLSSAAVPSEVDGSNDQVIGSTGGMDHFGIRVVNGDAHAIVLNRAVAAGGVIVGRGDVYGAPTAFVRDLDGYAMQVYVMPVAPQ
jgi:catechol 2,3-dioxygenase-like lactoylglutathione lyase family enzyme